MLQKAVDFLLGPRLGHLNPPSPVEMPGGPQCQGLANADQAKAFPHLSWDPQKESGQYVSRDTAVWGQGLRHPDFPCPPKRW